jgi:hypothetical protein
VGNSSMLEHVCRGLTDTPDAHLGFWRHFEHHGNTRSVSGADVMP